MLGRYFSGQKLNATLIPNYNGTLKFVEKYLDSGVGTLASIQILTKMSSYIESKPNPYYERMIKAYVNQFDTLWSKNKKRLEKIEPFIESFYEGDVCEWVDTIPSEAGFITYPPFYEGDYEKMFGFIDSIFDWSPPSFKSLDKERLYELLQKLIARDYFMFGIIELELYVRNI